MPSRQDQCSITLQAGLSSICHISGSCIHSGVVHSTAKFGCVIGRKVTGNYAHRRLMETRKSDTTMVSGRRAVRDRGAAWARTRRANTESDGRSALLRYVYILAGATAKNTHQVRKASAPAWDERSCQHQADYWLPVSSKNYPRQAGEVTKLIYHGI